MNQKTWMFLLLSMALLACKKPTPEKVTQAESCTWTYKNINYTGTYCYISQDSSAKHVFYMGDGNSDEAVKFLVQNLAVQSYDITNPMDSAYIAMNHKKGNTMYINMPATTGTIHITSLSMNLATVNFSAIIDGDTCIGSMSNVPY